MMKTFGKTITLNEAEMILSEAVEILETIDAGSYTVHKVLQNSKEKSTTSSALTLIMPVCGTPTVIY